MASGSKKRMTEDDVVAELRDGMTIGIGGWGSRRKPMSLVRAIARSPLRDLTIVSYGGPDVGILCATGRVKKVVYGFVSLDSIPLEPHFRAAREKGAIEVLELDEGMLQWGLQAASLRLPFLPTRAGLGSDVIRAQPNLRTVRSPYEDGEELVAVPAIPLDVALVHLNRADERGNAQYLGPDPYFDDLFCGAAKRRFVSCEKIVPTEELEAAGLASLLISRMMVDGVIEAPHGAHFTTCEPDYGRDEPFQREYAASAASPEAWGAFKAKYIDVGGDDYRPDSERPMSQWTLAELCAVACAEAFRGDGEILASPIGPLPSLGARLARATFEPDLLLTDGIARLVTSTGAVEGWMPYRRVFDVVWSGRRHVMMGASQIDRFGNQNIASIGDWRKPQRQLVGVRGAPGNTICHPTSYWIPNHGPRTFVPAVDFVCGVGYDRAAALGASAARFHEIRRVVTNLGVFDFETPDHSMRLRSVHPGVSVDEVRKATGFPLTVPSKTEETRAPTGEELRLIREVLDPKGDAGKELSR